jgi:general secretion pathway protein L
MPASPPLATASLANALQPLRLRYYDSPVPGWLRLLGGTLLSALPAAMRRQLGASRRRLLLQENGNELQLRALVDEQTTLVGSVPLDDPQLLEDLRARLDAGASGVPRWLLLDAGQVLRPQLPVPAGAEPRLREMMAHEIDRQTPFSVEQVSFEPRVVARDAATRQLRVELVVLPLARLAALLERLGPLAAGLAGIDVIAPDGTALGVNLLPAAQRLQRSDRMRLLHLGLAAAVLAIVFASLWITLGNRASAYDAWNGRVQQAQREAREARKLRNALEDSVRAANFLAKTRASQPTVLEILADLTHRLPDDTWLEKIQVNGGNVVLIGLSAHSTALVGLLQDSQLIHKPTLTGSVQNDPATGKERFTITAVIAGSDAENGGANGVPSTD